MLTITGTKKEIEELLHGIDPFPPKSISCIPKPGEEIRYHGIKIECEILEDVAEENKFECIAERALDIYHAMTTAGFSSEKAMRFALSDFERRSKCL